MLQKPSVGRIVHYVLPSPHRAAGAHCAALIVAVEDGDNLTLKVWKPDGDELITKGPSQDDSTIASGTWHWPERV